MSRRKFKTSGNGDKIRPCHVCGDLVNFVLWESETKERGKRIFHWANPDGTHHIHTKSHEIQHLRDILNEDMGE